MPKADAKLRLSKLELKLDDMLPQIQHRFGAILRGALCRNRGAELYLAAHDSVDNMFWP